MDGKFDWTLTLNWLFNDSKYFIQTINDNCTYNCWPIISLSETLTI